MNSHVFVIAQSISRDEVSSRYGSVRDARARTSLRGVQRKIAHRVRQALASRQADVRSFIVNGKSVYKSDSQGRQWGCGWRWTHRTATRWKRSAGNGTLQRRPLHLRLQLRAMSGTSRRPFQSSSRQLRLFSNAGKAVRMRTAREHTISCISTKHTQLQVMKTPRPRLLIQLLNWLFIVTYFSQGCAIVFGGKTKRLVRQGWLINAPRPDSSL